jgi:K+-transporting ATPase KdpF subunit
MDFTTPAVEEMPLHVGPACSRPYDCLLCDCTLVRPGLRKVAIAAMDITTIVVILLTVLLIAYLFATLLKPEKF